MTPHSFPVLRLQVEGMKHTIQMAFSEYAAQMDSDVQTAVEKFCAPENLKRVIEEIADKYLEEAIRDEIKRFFRHGAGKHAIASAVELRLSDSVLRDEPARFLAFKKERLERLKAEIEDLERIK